MPLPNIRPSFDFRRITDIHALEHANDACVFADERFFQNAIFNVRAFADDAIAQNRIFDARLFGDRYVGTDDGIGNVRAGMDEHPVAPDDGALVVAEGMVVVRGLGKRGEIGHLLQRQLVQRLAIVVQRGGCDAIGVEAEVDLVEIEFEDLVLGEGLLDSMGQQRLLHLAVDRPLVGEEKVFRDLLGDRRGADDLALDR